MNEIPNKNLDQDEYYDLGKLLSLFIRNKNFIGFFTIFTFTFSALYSLTLKRIWEGQFEIVLDLDNANSLGSVINSNELSQFLNFGNTGEEKLNTQVGILESPSVLMPIFDYVNTQRGEQLNKEITFSKWKDKNVKIDLKENTSILKIAYRDNDKEIISPVLEKISLAYQQYSGNKQKRSISITKNFLNEQINIYKNKSKESLRMAQEYGVDQDLTSLNFSPEGDREENSQPERSLSSINIEVMRVKAANQIKKINFTINKIKQLSDKDYIQLEFLGSELVKSEGSESVIRDLKKIDIEINDKKKKFRNNDKFIIELVERRDLLINLLRKRVLGYLEAQRVVEEAKLKAALRPKEVLITYKELLRNAFRNENTLITLENNLRIIELSEAKSEEPWELITNPTVLNSPVAPSRTRIGIIGILLGLIFGTLFCFIKEKQSGLIYEIEELKNLFKCQVIQEINTNNFENEPWEIFSLYFKDCPKGKKSLVIHIDNKEQSNVDYFSTIKSNIANNFSDDLFKSIDFVNEFDLNLEKKYFKIFLMVSMGRIKKDKIKTTIKKFEYYKSSVDGIITYK